MKFNINEANAQRKASMERRDSTRNQILADQQANAKRDAKALRAETAWFARQGK